MSNYDTTNLAGLPASLENTPESPISEGGSYDDRWVSRFALPSIPRLKVCGEVTRELYKL